MTADEIVKRLRGQSEFYSDGLGPLCGEAADRLEALQAENKRLREALNEIAGLIPKAPNYYRDVWETARAALREET